MIVLDKQEKRGVTYSVKKFDKNIADRVMGYADANQFSILVGYIFAQILTDINYHSSYKKMMKIIGVDRHYKFNFQGIKRPVPFDMLYDHSDIKYIAKKLEWRGDLSVVYFQQIMKKYKKLLRPEFIRNVNRLCDEILNN